MSTQDGERQEILKGDRVQLWKNPLFDDSEVEVSDIQLVRKTDRHGLRCLLREDVLAAHASHEENFRGFVK